jgi:hypothetical protein
MKTHVYAKIFGWAQFLLAILNQATQGGLPHGAGGWIGLIGSLAAAVGIHAASNTSGTT